MATEVTSIGVGMETDGVERGIRTLQQLASQGPRVEKSMQGIEAAASKVDKSLQNFGDGADKGLRAIGSASPAAEQGLGRVGKSAEDARKSMDGMARSASSIGSSIQTTPVTRSIDSVKTSALDASKAVDVLKSALAVTGIGIGVKEVISLADGYTKFTAQLRLASKSADDYAASMSAVRRISTDAQQGLAETGTLYARIANGTAELGLSQRKLSEITETVALGLKVSGATASESASAMLQLSQAFASGVLRGEEFNAVNEAAPRLMKALADGIGVPVGALREMASEGKITSQVMADALPKALVQIRKEAEQIQTIGGSFTVLKNNLLEFVGAGDKASGATKAISASVTGLANNLDTIAVAAGGLALILAGRYVGAMAAASASTAAMAASTARANIAAVAMAATMSPATAAVSAFGIAARGASTAVLGLFGGPWGLAITAITAAAGAFLYFRDSSEETIKSIGGLNQPLEELKNKLDDLPPEKRVSVIIDIEKSGRDAIKQADRDIEALVQSVAGAANIKMPLDEFEKLTDSIRDTAKSGGDLTPILQKAAQSGGIPQSVLQSWLNLAANIREAHNAAANAAGAVGSTMSGAGGDVADVFIGKTDTALRKEAEAVLKTTAAYKSRAEQMAEVGKQGTTLRATLKTLTDAGLGASQEAENLRARIAGVDERLASMSKSGSKGAGEIKKVENAYQTLSKRVGDYIEQLRIEATQADKASTAQKLQIQLDDLLVKSKGKVTAAKVASLKADIQTARAMEEEAKAVKRTVEAYHDYIKDQEDIARADVELSKAKEALWKSISDQNIELDNQSRMLELEASNIGKSTYERTLANEVLKAQIELEKELRDISNNQKLDAVAKDEAEAAARERAIKKIALAERKAYVTEWDKTSQIIGQTLQDYIMGGGKDAAQYLKRLFSTLVLQPIVQTAVSGVLGGAGQGGAGLLGGLQSGQSLWSAFSGGTSGTLASGVSGLGKLMGSSFLGELGAGISAGGQLGIGGTASLIGSAGGATGAGMAIGAALPWVAGGLAIASLFGAFGHKSTQEYGGSALYSAANGAQQTSQYGAYGIGLSSAAYDANILANVSGISKSIVDALDSTAKSFGKTVGYEAAAGFATDFGDEATWGALRISLGGSDIVNWQNNRQTRWAPKEFASGEEGYKQYLDAVAVDVKSALLAMDLPGWADQIVSAATDMESINAALQQVGATRTIFDSLGKSMQMFSGISGELQTQLLAASGSMEALSNNAGAFYQGFFSESERMEALQKQLRESLSGLGIGIDPSLGEHAKEQFRATVEAAMAGGQGELAAQLLALSGSFATAADYAQKFADGSVARLNEIMGQQHALWADLAEAEGDYATAAQRRYWIETAGMNQAEQAAYDYIAAIQQQVSAAQAASASLKTLGDQQWSLENQFLSLQGQTGLVESRTREKDLAGLLEGVTDDDKRRQITAAYDYNKALEKQIAAMQAAQQAANDAATSQQKAADAIKQSWQSIADGLVGEINRIRGLVIGDSSMGLDYYQAQFAVTTAQARAGDQSAAERLKEISQAMLSVAETGALSLFDLQRLRATTASSLEETLAELQKKFGLSVSVPQFAVGTNYVPQDMLAQIHQGEAIIPKAFNPWAGGTMPASASGDADLRAAVDRLTAEVQRLQEIAGEGNQIAAQTNDILDNVTEGGNAMRTQEIA